MSFFGANGEEDMAAEREDVAFLFKFVEELNIIAWTSLVGDAWI